MSLICPHCLQKTLIIRTSSQELPVFRKIWVQCQNIECGFTGAGHTEITHEISPSAMPNNQIQLQHIKKHLAKSA